MCRLRSYCIWKGCLLKALPFPGLKALLLQALPLLRAPGLGLAKPFKIKLMVRTISSIESLRLVGDRGSFASVFLDFSSFFPTHWMFERPPMFTFLPPNIQIGLRVVCFRTIPSIDSLRLVGGCGSFSSISMVLFHCSSFERAPVFTAQLSIGLRVV